MTELPSSAALPHLLLLDHDVSTASHVRHLRDSFRVTIPASIESGLEYLRGNPIPHLIISDVELNGCETFTMIAAAKQLQCPVSVLLTTADVDRVPDGLKAGVDAVLLKPFARNLLFTRLARLQRDRAEALQTRAEVATAKAVHLRDRIAARGHAVLSWPTTHCPHCSAVSVRCFDFVSHRRAWYACLACKKVWIAKRRD